MSHGYAFAFHDIDAHGGGVEKDIGHMIVQEIDLVYVEDASIGSRQNARFQGFDAFLDGPLYIQRAYYSILRGTQWQIYHRSLAACLFYPVGLALLKA